MKTPIKQVTFNLFNKTFVRNYVNAIETLTNKNNKNTFVSFNYKISKQIKHFCRKHGILYTHNYIKKGKRFKFFWVINPSLNKSGMNVP